MISELKNKYLHFGLLTVFNLFILSSNCIAAEKIIHLDFQREIVSLNGTWEYIENHRGEAIWETDNSNYYQWNKVEQPGAVLKSSAGEKVINTDCIWLKRTFKISPQQAKKDVVLKWGAVRFGAKVWINGKEINNIITNGPNTVLVPSNLVKEGSNTILLRVNGWNSLFKPETEVKKFPLIPVGGSSQGWGAKDPRILDDIWLEFYDQAYMKYILAIPNVNNKTVTFRIWLDAIKNLPDNLQIQIECKFQDDNEAESTQFYHLDNTKDYQEVIYKIDDPHLWWPDNPVMYNASLELKAGETLCDRTDFNFGMRQIEVVNGDYMLNNKRIRLHGSNMVHEWNWGPVFTENAKRYLVDEARNMNLNSFRTHTIPPITSWLDIADKNGIMFLAEMPLLFNYQDPKFTDEEWKIYRVNALEDEKAWISKIWNHPSIVVWVISNESPFDSIWEQTVLRDMVLSHDPTRPILRTGERTVETNDWHPCSNFNSMWEGSFSFMLDRHMQKGNASQTHTNSEYMNIFSSWETLTQKYLGDITNPDIKLEFAAICMEHTELMRHHEYDMILPYMYAGWTGVRLQESEYWNPVYPTPMAASLHSCMSPVIASMDLWNRNFTCAQEIEIPLHMISELYDEVNAEIEIVITTSDPVFIPNPDSLKTPVWTQKFEFKYEPLSHKIKNVKVQLPEKKGKYYLSVIVNRDGDRPVTSQRIVRTFSPEKPENNSNILVLGATQNAEKWLNDNDYKFDESMSSLSNADIILIWDATQLDNSIKTKSPEILAKINNGAKLVVLNQDSLNWDDLLAIKYGDKKDVTRSFIQKGEENNSLFEGISNEYFQRWNGLPLIVVDRELKGKFVDKSTKLLWAENPEHNYVISQNYGKGDIIISQLMVRNHIDKNSKNYDPVAEQILHNLLN